MSKALSIFAVAVALAALLTAIMRNGGTNPSPADRPSAEYAALEQRFQLLEDKYQALEVSYRGLQHDLLTARRAEVWADSAIVPGAKLATKVDVLSDKQTELEETVKSIDEFGIVKSMQKEVLQAYDTLLNTNLPAWTRAKQSKELKRYGLFDDQAVSSMMNLWNQAIEPTEKAAALHALSGVVTTPEFRDEILTLLNDEVQNDNASPRLRYTAVEALRPMLPDPNVEEWLQYMAENDPEPKLRSHAGNVLENPASAQSGSRGK